MARGVHTYECPLSQRHATPRPATARHATPHPSPPLPATLPAPPPCLVAVSIDSRYSHQRLPGVAGRGGRGGAGRGGAGATWTLVTRPACLAACSLRPAPSARIRIISESWAPAPAIQHGSDVRDEQRQRGSETERCQCGSEQGRQSWSPLPARRPSPPIGGAVAESGGRIIAQVLTVTKNCFILYEDFAHFFFWIPVEVCLATHRGLLTNLFFCSFTC